jgi:hypothetical protein
MFQRNTQQAIAAAYVGWSLTSDAAVASVSHHSQQFRCKVHLCSKPCPCIVGLCHLHQVHVLCCSCYHHRFSCHSPL